MDEAKLRVGADDIEFQAGLTGTITINTILPEITGTLTITGPGSSALTVRRSDAAGTPKFRIFSSLVNTDNATITGLTVANRATALSLV
jgi:hypothetical protein